MIRKKLIKAIALTMLAVSAMLGAAPSHAGKIWFSRANCVNNESITWDWPGRNYWLWTNSFHRHSKTGWQDPIRTGWQWTYRSAAVHWGEGMGGGWYVIGHHFEWIHPYGEILLGTTPTTGCNLGYFFPYW